MSRVYVNALKLPVKYYAPIGELIFRWAQLEYQIQEIIWRAIDIDNPEGRTLTVGMGARPLFAILGTLTLKWLTHPVEKEIVISIVKEARSLETFRNQLAHGSWQYPEGGRKSDVFLHYMKETKRRIMPKAVKHEPAEIKEKVENLRRLNEKAQELIFRIEARRTS